MQVANILSSTAFLGQIFEDFPESKPQIETLAIIPSIKNPRWLIPLKNKELIISSLALYQPSLLRAKLLKKMTVLAAKGGLSNLAMKNRAYLQRNDEAIRKIFKRDDLYYAFFLGTEGCHRKVTIQVMDKEGIILGYIKVADNENIDRLLENEAKILRDLLRLEIVNGLFPKVIYQGELKGTNVLILDTLKTAKSTFSSKLSEKHIEFLAEIFQKSMVRCNFWESAFVRILRQRLKIIEAERQEIGRLIDVYRKALDYVKKEIENKEIPFGLCHRDFTPWNTFFHNDKLYVFDWEYAEREYPPMLDIFHYIVQDGIMVRHLKPEGLLKRVRNNEKMLSKYSSLVGVKNDLWMPLLVCYLLDMSFLYTEREKGNVEGEILKMLETWAGMMEMIMAHSSELIAHS